MFTIEISNGILKSVEMEVRGEKLEKEELGHI
jgi:hypothetical protein